MASESARITSTSSRQVATLGALLIIFFLGMGFRLRQLDADSLWRDEIDTVTRSQLELPFMLQALAENSTLPPLTYVVTHFFIRLSGNGEFVLRLPAALVGSASILLIYKVGTMLWTRTEGLAAAFLLAVNPWHVRYSQEARPYALVVFLALLSFIFLIKALRGNSRGPWIAFALVTSLGLYNHYFAFLMVPALAWFAAWVTWQNRSSRRQQPAGAEGNYSSSDKPDGEPATQASLRRSMEVKVRRSPSRTAAGAQAFRLAGSLLLIAVLYAPWLPAMYSQVIYPDIGYRAVEMATKESIELALSFQHDLFVAHSGVNGPALLLFLALLGLGMARGRREYLLLAAISAAALFLFICMVRTRHWLHPRYGIHMLPLYLLFVARGTSTVGRALKRYWPRRITRGGTPLPAMTSLVILVGFLQMPSLSNYYLETKADWREAARYLVERLQPGDAIAVDGMTFRTGLDDDRVFICLPYYLSVYGIDNAPILRVREGLWRGLKDLEGWSGQLWAVVYYEDELADSATARVVGFHRVSVISLREPSGRAIQDTESMLKALLDIIPRGDAHFDVHLTLGDICIRAGQLNEAKSQLQMASVVQTDDPRAQQFLEAMTLRLQHLSSTLEGMQYPMWRNVGGVLALLGYDARQETAQAGDTLELTTWWRALRNMNEDYSVFLHLLDSDGRVCSQQDKLLRRGNRPTSNWQVGEIVTQRHRIVLPAAAPPGGYTIKAYVYYWETGQRLPVWDEHGGSPAGNAIVLQRIDVSDSGE